MVEERIQELERLQQLMNEIYANYVSKDDAFHKTSFLLGTVKGKAISSFLAGFGATESVIRTQDLELIPGGDFLFGRYTSCSGECVIVIDAIVGIVDVFLTFIGPVTVIVVLYMRVFVVAVSQARAMRSHVTAVTLHCSVKVTAKKSERKAASTLGVVIVVFLTCLCPYYCVTLTGQDVMLNSSSAAFVICLFYFNSCLNPLIYAFFYPWFRKSLKLIVTFEILKPNSSEISIL
ncbi:uncharacterized protein V6R79_019074 [Siganus canaliculatus]